VHPLFFEINQFEAKKEKNMMTLAAVAPATSNVTIGSNEYHIPGVSLFVSVIEDFGKNGSARAFEFNDLLGIDVSLDTIKPGDLILDIDDQGAFIRRLRSLDSIKGMDRGEVLYEEDFDERIERQPGEQKRFEVVGRVNTIIRDVQTRK
jgi:hypothetical protein